MDNFRNRVLSALDRIYRFTGPKKAVADLELAAPQLVHDVSREAEQPYLGMLAGDVNGQGFVLLGNTIVAGAASTVEGSIQLTPGAIAALVDPALTADTHDFFVHGLYASCDVAITQAQVWRDIPADLVGYITEGYALLVDASTTWVDPTGLSAVFAPRNNNWTPAQNAQPQLVPWGTSYWMRAAFPGVGTITWHILGQVVRKGCAPRGAA